MKKIKIHKKDLMIVKSYIQAQILIETLDDLVNESSFLLKKETNRYLKFLEKEVIPILTSMHKSNPGLFEKITNSLRKDTNKVDSYFEII